MSILAKVKNKLSEAHDAIALAGGKALYHTGLINITHVKDGNVYYSRFNRISQSGLTPIDAIKSGFARGTQTHRDLINEGVLAADTWPSDVPWDVEPQATVVDDVVVPATEEAPAEIIPHAVVVDAITAAAAAEKDPAEAEIARLLAVQAETEEALKNINSASDKPANPVLSKDTIGQVRSIKRPHSKDDSSK